MNNAEQTITCFLIDDDPDEKIILQLALEELSGNFEIVTAMDGMAALKKLKRFTFEPDFIFLDINMPRMNGRMCLMELKKLEQLNDIPVIIYTTSSDKKEKQEMLTLGATDYITKPVTEADLVRELSRVFKLRSVKHTA